MERAIIYYAKTGLEATDHFESIVRIMAMKL